MTNLLLHAVMAFVGVWAFAVLFHAPGRSCLWCGLIGTGVWVCYLLLMNVGLSAAISTVVTIFGLVVVSRILAALLKIPATVFVVTGIFPLVPGAGIYYTVYYFIMEDYDLFRAKGTETAKAAFAIALGIVLANAIPQRWFSALGRRNR